MKLHNSLATLHHSKEKQIGESDKKTRTHFNKFLQPLCETPQQKKIDIFTNGLFGQ
jgi:hypothetical protein